MAMKTEAAKALRGYRKDVEFPDLFKPLNPYLAAGLAAACYFGIVVLGKREGAQFIYFQF